MGTTKSRKSRRNNSRPAAYTFLSNITLGNENEQNHKNTNSAGDKDINYTLPTAHESIAENAGLLCALVGENGEIFKWH